MLNNTNYPVIYIYNHKLCLYNAQHTYTLMCMILAYITNYTCVNAFPLYYNVIQHIIYKTTFCILRINMHI